MFDQMKPIFTMYISHSQQGVPRGGQDSMKCLNFVNDPHSFI